MARTFGAATSDRIAIGPAAPLNDLNPFTYLLWVFPTTLTDNRRFFTKGVVGTGGFQYIGVSGTSGNIEIDVRRATTSTRYVSSNTPIATTSAWAFLAGTFDSAATPVTHLYKGSLTAAVAECTYGTTTDGAGSVNAQGGSEPLEIGNSSGANVAFQGRIAHLSVFPSVLSAANIELFRTCTDHRALAGALSLTINGYWPTPESEASTALDQSGNGNNGTITGATVSADPALLVFRERRHRGMLRGVRV